MEHGSVDEAIVFMRKAARDGSKYDREEALERLVDLGEPAVSALADALDDKNLAIRALASQALITIGTDSAYVALRNYVCRTLPDIALKERKSNGYQLLFSALLIPLAIYIWFLYGVSALKALGFIGVVIFCMLRDVYYRLTRNPAAGNYVSVSATTSTWIDTIRFLRNRHDGETIAVLCQCVAINDGSVKKMVVGTLKKVLPTVRATDAAHFRGKPMTALIYTLNGNDHNLTLAILQALEQIGDESAIPTVERLAAKAKDKRVRAAAEACLPALRQRVELAKQTDTLLRPAERPADSALLRPASATPSDERLLLRPSDGEDA